MINIPKIENYALKNQAAKREYSKQIVLQNNDNETQSTYSKQAFSFKVLACQIKAMAIQVLSVYYLLLTDRAEFGKTVYKE